MTRSPATLSACPAVAGACRYATSPANFGAASVLSVPSAVTENASFVGRTNAESCAVPSAPTADVEILRP